MLLLNQMEIPKELRDSIWEYCRFNDISNIDEFIIKILRQGFTAEKYGATPMGLGKVAEPEIIERIVEKIVEVPVIQTVSTELDENLKQHIELLETVKQELSASLNMSNVLREELEACKHKQVSIPPKDIYGDE